MRLFFCFLLAFLYGSPLLSAQYTIDFSSCEKSDKMDFFSLYPFLILKHEIGQFYKLPKNPVLSPSKAAWDSEDVADPFVWVTTDSIYLFYDGSNDVKYSIGYAVRDKDGWGWIKRGQILKPDNVPWRLFHIIAPTLIPGTDILIYSGNSRDSELGYRIGTAQKKSDLWQFTGVEPVFSDNPKAWDFAGNAYQDVIYLPDEKKYKMWYSGFTGPLVSIGMAESADGINWHKTATDPVFKSIPGAIAPEVIFNGKEYTMFYTQLDLQNGRKTLINSARSADGMSWHSVKNILKPEGGWEGRSLMRPDISYFENQYHLYYCAQRGSNWQIGEATADAVFKASGEWISKPLTINPSKITVDYEMPARTNLLITLLDASDRPLQEIDLSSGKQKIRNGVFRSVFSDMPVFRKIRIKMTTGDPSKSPLIYNFVLEN